jgi:hypothetical protein
VRIEVDTLEHKNQTLAAVCSRTLEQFEQTVNTGAYALANVDENLQYLPKAIEELEAKLGGCNQIAHRQHFRIISSINGTFTQKCSRSSE